MTVPAGREQRPRGVNRVEETRARRIQIEAGRALGDPQFLLDQAGRGGHGQIGMAQALTAATGRPAPLRF